MKRIEKERRREEKEERKRKKREAKQLASASAPVTAAVVSAEQTVGVKTSTSTDVNASKPTRIFTGFAFGLKKKKSTALRSGALGQRTGALKGVFDADGGTGEAKDSNKAQEPAQQKQKPPPRRMGGFALAGNKKKLLSTPVFFSQK